MSQNPQRKPSADYPDIQAWFAVLDHATCRKDHDGTCWDIHCVQCGEAMGGGWAPCSKGCKPEALT